MSAGSWDKLAKRSSSIDPSSKKVSAWLFPPLVKREMSSKFNSHVERRVLYPQQPNKRRHVLPLAVGYAWRLDKHSGQYWKLSLSHFHSRAQSLFFSRLLSRNKPSLGKAIRVQQDMHVFESMEENTIVDSPPFFFSLDTAPRDIFRLGVMSLRSV